jgi:hypothetical protein
MAHESPPLDPCTELRCKRGPCSAWAIGTVAIRNFRRKQRRFRPPLKPPALVRCDAPHCSFKRRNRGLCVAGWQESDGPKEEVAKYVVELLLDKAEMLEEYRIRRRPLSLPRPSPAAAHP